MEKHESQKDYKTGFGGKFGVQSDRVDKSALGWEHIEKVEKHQSQKGKHPFYMRCQVVICPTTFSDYSSGFGGKFGVQSDRVDKSALGWEHVEKVEKHESQIGNSEEF